MAKRRNNRKRYVITSEQLFDARKPQFNGFGCGHGAHGSAKYNRRKNKREMMRELRMDLCELRADFC